MLRRIFVDPKEDRLRVGWRLILFLLAVPITMRILNLAMRPIFGRSLENNTVNWVFRGIIVTIGSTLIVYVFRKFMDKKSLVSLGLRFDKYALSDALIGFLLSGLMVCLFFTMLLAFGMLKINAIHWQNNGLSPIFEILLLFFGIGFATGYSEELGFRGYILQNLSDGIGLMWAVVVSCIFYGIMHMTNPNSTLLSGVLIALFGFLRIFGLLRTGQLWLSIGMHAGWNFFQGPIFGFSVSGLDSEHLIDHTITGPDWMNGGTFGPEAGILVIPIVLFGLLAMFLWTLKRKNTPCKRGDLTARDV